jgi:hypothetical protein
LSASTIAREITFNVVSLGQAVSVKAGEATVPLKLTTTPPLWSAAVNVADNANGYAYIQDGVSEDFIRTLPAEAKTYNDFYGDPITVQVLPPLGNPLSAWTRSVGPTPFFDDSYVPSMFFTSSSNQDKFQSSLSHSNMSTSLTIIFKDQVKVIPNTNLAIHRPGDKSNMAKQSWRIYFPEEIFGRSFLKLRNSDEDPTNMREKIYADTLKAAGCPANEANLIKMYINGESIGFFTQVDDVNIDSFALAMFYGDMNPYPSRFGVMEQGMAFADFTPGSQYNFAQQIGQNYVLGPVTKWVPDLTAATLPELEKVFDVETFIRAMAIEFLNGHWDGFWGQYISNFAVFQDILTGNGYMKFYFIDHDFDNTFGVNYPEDDIEAVMNRPYAEHAQLFEKSTLMTKLLAIPSVKTRFETILKTLVEKMYNPNILGKRVEAMQNRYHSYVAWDRQIDRQSPGINYHWTILDYEAAFTGPTGGVVGSGDARAGLSVWVNTKSEAVRSQFNLVFATEPTIDANAGKTKERPVIVNHDSSSASFVGSSIISMILLTLALFL